MPEALLVNSSLPTFTRHSAGQAGPASFRAASRVGNPGRRSGASGERLWAGSLGKSKTARIVNDVTQALGPEGHGIGPAVAGFYN